VSGEPGSYDVFASYNMTFDNTGLSSGEYIDVWVWIDAADTKKLSCMVGQQTITLSQFGTSYDLRNRWIKLEFWDYSGMNFTINGVSPTQTSPKVYEFPPGAIGVGDTNKTDATGDDVVQITWNDPEVRINAYHAPMA